LDKEEGIGLGEGVILFWKNLGQEEVEEILKKRKIGRTICFGNSHMGTVVAGNFGLGGQETARILELGS
jgi:hypothetical protein